MALKELHEEIARLGGRRRGTPEPLVSLELFFDGNRSTGSIAPNVSPHPGVEHIASALREIRARPDVHDVLVGIDEVMGEPFWPYASHVYVVTSAHDDEVRRWAERLAADPPSTPWWADLPPVNPPAVPPGARIVMLWWD
jgi:hypothetical protein